MYTFLSNYAPITHTNRLSPELLLCPLLTSALVTGVHPQMREPWKALAGGLQQYNLSPSWSGTFALWTLALRTNPSVSTSK